MSLAQRTHALGGWRADGFSLQYGAFEDDEQPRGSIFYDARNGAAYPPAVLDPGLQGRVPVDGLTASKRDEQQFDIGRGRLALGSIWSRRLRSACSPS